VNPEPLGRCPFDEDCGIVESPTQFLCERKLKELESGKDPELPKGCGFALPRTVCKREITRDEALVYLANRRTDVLTDFTSRYGRPFSATLVLKENGRHGFEFPPRKAGEGGRKTTRKKKKSGTKKVGRKTTTRKKKTTVKASGKKATAQTPTRKAAGRKKATKTAAKASSRKKATRRPAPGDDA